MFGTEFIRAPRMPLALAAAVGVLGVAYACGGVAGTPPSHIHVEQGAVLYTDVGLKHSCGTSTEAVTTDSVGQWVSDTGTVEEFKIHTPPHIGNCPGLTWVNNFNFVQS